ncbi:MAG: hypothetical protein WBZ48_08955 [Bacteroidota bacterium]
MKKFALVFFIIVSTPLGLFAQRDSTAVDSTLLKQLEQQMQPAAPAPEPQASAPHSAPTTNPDMSAIGDFRTLYTSEGSRKVELYFNQLEVQMASVVDPYARANFLFSFSKDTSSGNFGADIEEATVTSIDLPYSLEVTLGKFKPHFTKVNLLHPHAFSFVDFPSMLTRYFTDEGLFMEGVSASWLVPNPWDYYQELDVEVGRSDANNTLDQGNADKLTYVGHLKNFFDLTDNATLELGLSGLSGVNAEQFTTTMGGVDITYKWKPVQFNTFQSFTWQTEAIVCKTSTLAAANVQTYGAYSFVEYQVERRTFLGAKFDYSALPGNKSNEDRVSSVLVRFQPTEFQILALEFQRDNRSYGADANQVILRAIFVIGAHGAHQY